MQVRVLSAMPLWSSTEVVIPARLAKPLWGLTIPRRFESCLLRQLELVELLNRYLNDKILSKQSATVKYPDSGLYVGLARMVKAAACKAVIYRFESGTPLQ